MKVRLFAGILMAVLFFVVACSNQAAAGDGKINLVESSRDLKSVTINMDAGGRVVIEAAADAFPEISEAQAVATVATENAPNCHAHYSKAGELLWVYCDDGVMEGVPDMAIVEAVMGLGQGEYIVPSMGVYVVSRLFAWSNWGGSQFTQTTSYASMCSGAEYWMPNLNSYGWGNKASSATAYGNCGRLDLYTNANYVGGVLGCTQGCSNLGALGFDNNAESTKTK